MLHRLRPALVTRSARAPGTSGRSVGAQLRSDVSTRRAHLRSRRRRAAPGTTRRQDHAGDRRVHALKSSFDAANTTFTKVAAPLDAQMRTIGANARAACAAALAARNPGACRSALASARAALRPLLDAWRTAARVQRAAIMAAGTTFAATIRTLSQSPPPATNPPPPPPVDPDPIGIT